MSTDDELVIRVVRTVLELFDAAGLQQVSGEGRTMNHVHRGELYGFTSRPPKGTGQLVLVEGVGRITIADVDANRPAGQDKEVILYDSAGNKMTFRDANGAGGIELEPRSGKKVSVHQGGTKKAVARHDDNCKVTAGMATWMSQVAGYINGQVLGTVNPAAVDPIATVAATSATLEAE